MNMEINSLKRIVKMVTCNHLFAIILLILSSTIKLSFSKPSVISHQHHNEGDIQNNDDDNVSSINAKLNADWSVFTDLNSISPYDSFSIIKSLPLKRYWDVVKGKYRIGLLPDDIQNLHPDYINVVEKQQYQIQGKNIMLHNISFVDYGNLFMFTIGCIQELSDISRLVIIQDWVNNQRLIKSRWINLLEAVKHSTQLSTFQFANNLRLKNEWLEQQIQNTRRNHSYHILLTQNKIKKSKELYEMKIQSLEESDKRLRLQLENYHSNRSLEESYYHTLLEIEKQLMKKEIQSEFDYLKEEYELTRDMWIREYSVWVNTVEYRLQEESRIAKLYENHQKKIIQMQYQYSMKSVEAIMNEMFHQINVLLVQGFYHQPQQIMNISIILLSILFGIFFLLEIVNMIYRFYYNTSILKKIAMKTSFQTSSLSTYGQKLKRRMIIIRKTENNENNENNNHDNSNHSHSSDSSIDQSIDNRMSMTYIPSNVDMMELLHSNNDNRNKKKSSDYYIVSREIMDPLTQIIQIYRQFSDQTARRIDDTSIFLPNILIYGSLGTGKSYLMEFIASSSNLSYVIVNGNDLLALHSHQSGAYLQKLIDYMKFRSTSIHPSILFIDNVDPFIKFRPTLSINENTEMTTSTHDCFYILLEAMRIPSNILSFVFISSQTSLLHLDRALLDRMDKVIELSLPNIDQRLYFLVFKSIDLLSDVMPSYAIKQLSKLKSDACSNQKTGTGYIALLEECQIIHNLFQVSSSSSSYSIHAEDILSVHIPSLSRLSDYLSSTIIDSSKPFIPNEHHNDNLDEKDEKDDDEEKFDVGRCFSLFTGVLRNGTYRDMMKILSSIRSEALGSERCKVTTKIWLREVQRYISAQHQLHR